MHPNMRRAGNILSVGAALACVTSGCGKKAIDRSGFGEAPRDLETLRVSTGVEYLAYIAWTGTKTPATPEGAGRPCATAKDADACKLHVEKTNAAGGFGFPHGGVHLGSYVTSSGDVVREIKTTQGWMDLFRTVDSPTKAYFLLKSQGYSIEGDHWVRKSKDGFEIIGAIVTSECPIVKEEQRVEVHPEGSFTVLERVETLRKDACR